MIIFLSYILFFFIPLFIDRVTKYLIVCQTWQNKELFSFLNINLTYNRGISWGIGNYSNPQLFIFICILVAFVIFGFCWYLYKMDTNSISFYAGLMILSGAISNFFDRLWFNGIVDFIQFHYFDWFFPTFNFADTFIFLGTCLLLYAQAKDEFFK